MKNQVHASEEAIELVRALLRRMRLIGELTQDQEEILNGILSKASHAIRIGSPKKLLSAVSNFSKKCRQFVN